MVLAHPPNYTNILFIVHKNIINRIDNFKLNIKPTVVELKPLGLFKHISLQKSSITEVKFFRQSAKITFYEIVCNWNYNISQWLRAKRVGKVFGSENYEEDISK